MKHLLLITLTMLLTPFQLPATTSSELLAYPEASQIQQDNSPLFHVQHLQFSPVSVKNGQLKWKPSKRDVNIAYELPQVFLSGCTLWSQLNSTTEDIPYQVVGENMEVLSNGVLSCQTGTQSINLDEVQPGAYYLLLIVGEELYAASFILSH